MVCLRFCQHSDVTFLKEFQQCLNSRYLASTFFSLYTLIESTRFLMKPPVIIPPWHSNKTVTLRKHVANMKTFENGCQEIRESSQ